MRGAVAALALIGTGVAGVGGGWTARSVADEDPPVIVADVRAAADASLGEIPDPAAPCDFLDTTAFLADPSCSPGAVATADKALVCRVGYSDAVRDVPEAVRDAVLASYGLAEPDFTGHVDHVLALSLGGSNDPANLAPTSAAANAAKNTVERRVRRAVCAGALPVAEAQARFLARLPDWRAADDDLTPP